MMLPTHILAGGTLGLILSILEPQLQIPLIMAGMIAGVVPDLDMLHKHRRTLHRPIQYSLSFGILILVYYLTMETFLLLLSSFTGSLVLHTTSEILGQGKTMNSNLKKDQRCVYNHVNGRWIKPLRLIKVGSFKDLLSSLILSIPLLIIVSNRAITALTLSILLLALIEFSLTDWITKNYLSDYDRYSEPIQQKIGLGPETHE